MGFVSILVALLLEQARPVARANPIHALVRIWVRWSGHNFDAGKSTHAVLAWTVAVVVPGALAMAVYWLLVELAGWPLAITWNILVLYLTLGFRQFSHHFTEIRDALDASDFERARQLLARWRQVDPASLRHDEVVRQVIEHSVIAAHRHVFGVLAWFSILSAAGLGPAGAILYRLAEFAPRYWAHQPESVLHPVSVALQRVAARSWDAIDWLPARITAMGFAVVGSFEEAIESWRSYTQLVQTDNDGVILSATAGAIGLALGANATVPVSNADQSADESVDGPGWAFGQRPEVGHLRTVVGLVWRTVLMWMILLALLTLARLLG